VALGVFHDLGRSDDKCGFGLAPPIFTNLGLFADTISAIVVAGTTSDNLRTAAASQIPALVTELTATITAAAAG
jgi:hypothetical protein